MTCSVVVPSTRSCLFNACATVPSPALAAVFGTQLFERVTDRSAADEVVSLGFQTAVVAPQSTSPNNVVGEAEPTVGAGVGVPSPGWTKTQANININASRLRPAILLQFRPTQRAVRAGTSTA